MKLLVVLPLLIFILVVFSSSVYCQRPAVVNIGAIFTFNSVIGRTAKVAMEAAVADVNADPTILSGTELKLSMKDVNCSVFMGSIEGALIISCLNFIVLVLDVWIQIYRILHINWCFLMVLSIVMNNYADAEISSWDTVTCIILVFQKLLTHYEVALHLEPFMSS